MHFLYKHDPSGFLPLSVRRVALSVGHIFAYIYTKDLSRKASVRRPTTTRNVVRSPHSEYSQCHTRMHTCTYTFTNIHIPRITREHTSKITKFLLPETYSKKPIFCSNVCFFLLTRVDIFSLLCSKAHTTLRLVITRGPYLTERAVSRFF